MNRTLPIDVVHSSWPGPGNLPDFPSAFHVGTSDYDLNIPSMLLMIGYLTTPTSSTGVSLSEFWAWVRYLAAVTSDADMRLTSSFADLDAHQKTILSDDFGMGVPMVWLSERLAFDRICDGRYFLERIAATIGATARRTAKRGPNKAPDFVARDTSGVWHVIECKGTQSGIDYCFRQLGSEGPPPSGGWAQKRSIIFPPAYTGQRLVTGLSIAVEGGVEEARLTIIDPEPEEEPFEVTLDQIAYANDAATRSVVAKTLRLAGFEIVAETTASPLGPRPSSTPSIFRKTEEARRHFVEERDIRAREELATIERRRSLFDTSNPFRGRELTFDLPRPILVGDRPVMRAIVRQGVNESLLSELRERPTIEDSLAEDVSYWGKAIGGTRVEGDELSASMKIGDIFRSEIYLD
jgi:hypothetical protein